MNLFTTLLFGTAPQPQIKTKPSAVRKPVEPKTREHRVSEEAMRKVLDTLSFEKYASTVEIAERCGYSIPHVRHALKKLHGRKEVTRRTLKHGHVKWIRK